MGAKKVIQVRSSEVQRWLMMTINYKNRRWSWGVHGTVGGLAQKYRESDSAMVLVK